jgi:DNA-binding response OmpR family regulator
LKVFDESSFDAAIVDIFLAESNGFDVIAALRERVPTLPIVAVSGMTALDFMSQSADFSNVQCLRKPFRPNELIRAIAAAGELVQPRAGIAAAV